MPTDETQLAAASLLRRLEEIRPGLTAQLEQVYSPPAVSDDEYSAAFENAISKTLLGLRDLERVAARQSEIDLFPTLPPARQELLFRNSPPRFQLACLLRLEAAAYELRFSDRTAGLALVEHALALRPQLNTEPLSPSELAEVDSKLHAQHGNFLRIIGKYEAAHAAFARAHTALERALWPQHHAWVVFLEASLFTAEARAPEALELLDEAIAEFKFTQDPHLPYALSNRGIILLGLGDPVRAAHSLAAVSTQTHDPFLLLVSAHNFTQARLETGDAEGAYQFFLRLQPSYDLPVARPFQPQRLWLQGLLLTALNRHDEAIPSLRQARTALLERESHHEALLCGLDLAFALLPNGPSHEATTLAQDLLRFAQAQHLGVDADRARQLLHSLASDSPPPRPRPRAPGTPQPQFTLNAPARHAQAPKPAPGPPSPPGLRLSHRVRRRTHCRTPEGLASLVLRSLNP